MKYKIESIGASFNDKTIAALERNLTNKAQNGWEFHSVFSVEKQGCLGQGNTTTYLAIFTKDD